MILTLHGKVLTSFPLFGFLFLHVFSEFLFLSLFQENYTAPRMVLAASGIEQEEFLSIAEPLVSDLPSVSRQEEPKFVYVGGDYRCQAYSGVCISNCSLLVVSCLIDLLILFFICLIRFEYRSPISFLHLKCLVVGIMRKKLSL